MNEEPKYRHQRYCLVCGNKHQQEKYREPYWLDTSAVSCKQIQIEGKEEILLYSFRAG